MILLYANWAYNPHSDITDTWKRQIIIFLLFNRAIVIELATTSVCLTVTCVHTGQTAEFIPTGLVWPESFEEKKRSRKYICRGLSLKLLHTRSTGKWRLYTDLRFCVENARRDIITDRNSNQAFRLTTSTMIFDDLERLFYRLLTFRGIHRKRQWFF